MSDIRKPWEIEAEDVLTMAGVSADTGLSLAECGRRLAECGPNTLKAEAKVTCFHRLLVQFKSPVVITLLVATVISALLGETVDAIAIATIVVILKKTFCAKGKGFTGIEYLRNCGSGNRAGRHSGAGGGRLHSG